MKPKIRVSLVVFAFAVIGLLSYLKPQPLKSVKPTNVKDTLSSSQLSFFARIGTGVSAGDSLVRINQTSGSAPSITTSNLFVGDTIAIGTSGAGTGNSGPLTLYTVRDIASTASFQLNSGIGTSNAYSFLSIIATRSAIHTVSFTPQSNITGGFWQFLIKASSRTGEVYNDGIPDQQGFDLGATTPSSGANGLGTRLKTTDVTCPNFGAGTTAASIGTTVAVTTSAGTNYYHVINCALGAGNTNAIGVGYSVAIGADLATGSQLINPSNSLGHVEGAADNSDVYTFYVRHLDSSQVVADEDTLQGKIALVEAVRITATIDPTLTFTIDNTNVGSGATICGVTLNSNANNVTATQVPFGSLSLGNFNDLAQRISCVTNSANGYVVTAYQSGYMKNIANGITIPNTNCNTGCNVGTTGLWTTPDAAQSEWGFGMQNINASYTFSNITAGVGSSFTGAQFGTGAANATVIMRNNSTPVITERAFVCYRLTAITSQVEGDYENKVVYTATATF
ncbi:MAG TPA: hypothetical protein PK639_03730 [Candidatus Woesebacteria bacterium]|nr:hypothetical protein [Candidatus Woesebacteria bacterium]